PIPSLAGEGSITRKPDTCSVRSEPFGKVIIDAACVDLSPNVECVHARTGIRRWTTPAPRVLRACRPAVAGQYRDRRSAVGSLPRSPHHHLRGTRSPERCAGELPA